MSHFPRKVHCGGVASGSMHLFLGAQLISIKALCNRSHSMQASKVVQSQAVQAERAKRIFQDVLVAMHDKSCSQVEVEAPQIGKKYERHIT